eukprot:m.44449 g.44449  ORF g.44449 m.44449 type:complete len:244 (+) comp6525_c0_seq2:38-769(+)
MTTPPAPSAGAASTATDAGGPSEPPSDDALFGLSWSDPRFPVHELSVHNALHYFCQPGINPFYDRTCNNERLKQMNNQLIDTERLSQMTGKEYAIVHSQPPVLHLIQERVRHSPSSVTPRAMFYMVQGVVYKCPDLGTLVHAKLATAMHHLQASLDAADSIKTFTPTEGYVWEDDKLAMAAAAGKGSSGSDGQRDTPAPDRRLHGRVTQLIGNMSTGGGLSHDAHSHKRRGDPVASPRPKKAK